MRVKLPGIAILLFGLLMGATSVCLAGDKTNDAGSPQSNECAPNNVSHAYSNDPVFVGKPVWALVQVGELPADPRLAKQNGARTLAEFWARDKKAKPVAAPAAEAKALFGDCPDRTVPDKTAAGTQSRVVGLLCDKAQVWSSWNGIQVGTCQYTQMGVGADKRSTVPAHSTK